MSDTIQNGQIPAEGETAEPMPSSEQPAEDAQEEEVVEDESPEQVKSRTAEQFEKLKATNRELSEKLKALEGSKPTPSSVLDELRPSVDTAALPPVPTAGNQPLVDNEGYIDANLLNSTVSGTRQAAEEAKRISLQTQQQIQRFQESQVVQAVHKDFPEIDPNSDQFDPAFYDFVKNDLIGQMMKGTEDLRAAADKARKTLGKKQAEPEPRKETISSRGQASAPTGTSKGTPPTSDEQASLVERSYKGDKDAIFKRLQASGN
jgi:hypothetical protein